jgi:CheY-like chemotaxis protein
MAVDLRSVQALIADDDRHKRDLLRNLLADLGLPADNIRQCANGDDALDLLSIRRADFLISGQDMSPMDGLSLIRALRDPTRTPAPGIPVIFCSASVDIALLDTLYNAGVNDILLQPFNTQAVEQRVMAVLERPRPLLRTDTYVGPDNTGTADDDPYWTIC